MCSYLKSEKLVHSNLEYEKMFPIYLEVEKFCFRYFAAIWREKSESLLFGDHKMLLTTVWSNEKDYDSYLKSEKLFTAIWSATKMFPNYLEVEKTDF